MGDRFGNQGRGNWRGGGYGYSSFQQPYNQYQRPPPPRPIQEYPQYKRKDQVIPSNSNNQARNQYRVQTLNQSQASDGAQSVAGTGGSSAVGSSSAAGFVSATPTDLSKVLCLKCREKGHATKNCTVKVECVNCGKTSHLSEMCTWLKQRKPIASFVGFGGPGLGCFVAEHGKELAKDDKSSDVALVKIIDGSSPNVSSDRLKYCLGRIYPWKWDWKGICEAGSTIGHVMEVDMESVKELKIVRIKISVIDHRLIPVTTRVTTPDLFYYNVRFKIGEVIEEGWVEDEALLKTLADMDDQWLDGIEEREAKRQKNIETSHLEENKPVQASENTKQALLQRELSQRQHDEMDADRIEDVTKVGDSEEADKVKLSDDGMGEDEDYEGYEESNGEDGLAEEETLRCSGRLANKNNEDIPVMDRAKNLAATRNLDPSEGY
ncbi:hypothetical protein ACQ4PT_007012 [Festuca glaucescens]